MTTLSACDTGVGKLQGQEGISNLVEAFLVAGSKSVVASLWSADDTSASALMERFYQRLAQVKVPALLCAMPSWICCEVWRSIEPVLLGGVHHRWRDFNPDWNQTAMNLTLEERTKIFDKVLPPCSYQTLRSRMNGVDWNALARERRNQILATTDPEVFEKEVHKLVAELKTSHTGFRHAGMRNIPARHAINATLQRIGVNGSECWMFQDVHQGGPAFAAGIRPGDLLIQCGGREIRPPNDLTFSVGESASLLIEKAPR